MKERTVQPLPPSLPGVCPPGSRTDAPAEEAPSGAEPEENSAMERSCVLTADLVSRCISHLGHFGSRPHLYQLSLPSQNLSDVSILRNYVHLQKLELPHNKIKDLSCVSRMPYLVILDASHNEIFSFFGFQPPKGLKEASFSHNRMTKMKDLSAYSYLSKLDLDHNGFTEITGLEQCCKLTHLSLAHNKISRISGLGSLPLTNLCLRGNQLERIEGLENLKNLRVLDLSQNRITSLSGLQSLCLLGSINLEKNLITEIQECKHIHDLLLLRELSLLENPVQEHQDYRLSVVFLLQHLIVLDGENVTAEEKVSSVNKYDPSLDVVSARNHVTHMVYQLMQPQVLYDSTLPGADYPYPMLVLTGPQGCGKRELAHRLCQEFSEYFAYGTCHTTRGPYYGEENGIDYHFVSEEDFQNMIHMGKFVQTMQYGGHSFGLTRDAIEDVAREGLACCVHMELEGVFSLRKSCFEPRYILLFPSKVETYRGRLKSRGIYSPAQIEMAVSRIDIYAQTNIRRPGFFDHVVPCDDLEEAYHTLKLVLKEYLLLEEDEEGEQHNRGSPDSTMASANEPEEKAPSHPSALGSGTLTSQSATALDPSNPCYRNYFTKIHAELSPEKSPAEFASIRRRERLVREAIVGKSPGVYSQRFKSLAEKAPSPLQTHDSGSRFSETSSSDESRAASVLSVPSSAGALAGSLEPLHGAIVEPTQETLTDHLSSDQTPDQLSSATFPSPDRRPGSNVRPILPPIPAGRKTPAARSLTASPRPSPNPAAGNGGAANANE